MMKSISYIKEWYINPSRKKRKLSNPTALNFPITDNCNSRCVMCNVWIDKSKHEITNQEILNYFSGPIFKNLQHVGISGGEPTLRTDLVECIDAIVTTLPALKTLSITSHGYHFQRWSRFLPKIKEITKRGKVNFSLNLSLDGVGDVHNDIRGVKTAFNRVIKTFEIAKSLNIPVQFQCTISKFNIYHVGQVLAFAQRHSTEVIFRYATTIERLNNEEIMPNVCLQEKEKSFLADFFLAPALHRQTLSPARRLYYKKMSIWLIEGGNRPFPCYFQNEGVLVTSQADVYSCSITDKKLGNLRKDSAASCISSESALKIRELVKDTDCLSCIHDQTGAWSPIDLIISQLEYKGLLNSFLNIKKIASLILDLCFGFINNLLPISKKQNNNQAVLIGAYGGEHVGDAAILGGVILRLVKKYDIQSIVVASFRPNRTVMWTKMLDTSASIKVVPYNNFSINKYLKESQYVVYAGGPLMELPALLAKHLAVLAKAKKMGCTLIIEGVGLGPLFSFFTKYLVRKILYISHHVSIRTKLSKVEELMPESSNITEVSDPAFDYLASRTQPNLIGCSLKEEILQLMGDAEIKVAINLRPLWDKYNFDKNISIEQVEKEYLNQLAKSLLVLQNEYGKKISFFFFPMNPDQFGMSDLSTAYKLSNILDERIQYTIWEAEPDIDSVLFFLTKMDTIISMRFHGCIFAMTHGKNKLIGIDYQIGKPGKVAQLMQEYGLEFSCVQVESLNHNVLVEKIKTTLK